MIEHDVVVVVFPLHEFSGIRHEYFAAPDTAAHLSVTVFPLTVAEMLDGAGSRVGAAGGDAAALLPVGFVQVDSLVLEFV